MTMDPSRRPVVMPPPNSSKPFGYPGTEPAGPPGAMYPPPGAMYPPPGAMHPPSFAGSPGAVYPPHLKGEWNDVELGYGQRPPLYPYIAPDENARRWAFIRKVYTILCLQLILTAIVAGIVAFVDPVTDFLVRTPGLVIGFAFLPFIFLCPLYCYREKFPINLVLLALFTASLSLTIGMACAFTNGKLIWEAALLTAVVAVSLTLYTFWAARRGHDFSFLGPILFASLMIIIVFMLIQIFFPLGRLSHAIIGGIAALVFSGYIIYDTDNLIKRYSYDQYVWASVALYLDIINVFLSLLTLFRATD